MTFEKTLIGGAVLAFLAISPAQSAGLSITYGLSDFDIDYQFTSEGTTQGGSTVDDFEHYNLGLTFDRGAYSFGLNVGGLLEQPADEFARNGSFINTYDTSRVSRSLSVSRPISDKLSLTVGYYSAELTMESDQPGLDDSIATDALYGSVSYSDRLTDTMFYYARLGAQINEADMTVNTDEGPRTPSLDGDGVVMSLGIYYPLENDAGLTFGVEHKDFTYDGDEWRLAESQSLFTIGYNFQF